MNDILGTIAAGAVIIGIPVGIIVGVVALITLTVKWIWGA